MDSTPTAAEAARKSSTSSSPSNRNQHHQSQHLDNLQKSAVARQPLQLQIPLHPTCGGRFSDGSQSASPSMLASFYNSLHSNGNTNSPQHLPQQQASPRSSDEYWYSLEGYLLMKSQGGALNFLQSKRRLYFGLDELANQLIYYKDKSDFDKKRDCLGAITLDDSVCSLDDGNLCAFFLHSVGKKLMLEAESEGCAQGWLRALQQRRDSNDEWGSRELPLLIVDPPRMRRIRSTSEPSEDSSDTGVRGYYSHRPLPPLHLDVADGDITPTPERLQAKQSGHGLPSPSFTTEHEPKSPKPAATVEPASMTDRVSPLPVYSSGSLLNGHRRGVKAASWRKDSHAGMGQRQYTLCRERSLEEVEHEYGLRRSPPGEDPSALQSPRNPNHHQYGNGWVVGGNGEHRTPPEIALISPAHLSPAQLPHPDNHIAHSPDVGSTLTSHCNSRRTSTTSSSTYGMANMAEEITMLRLVNNRQKERNQELNEECNRWRFEAERWRVESEKLKGQLTMSKMGNGTLLSGLSPLAIGPYNHQHQQQLDPASSLAAQNRFLNAEVLRLNDRLSDINNQHAELREHLEKCEEDIDDMRKEYVFLLQSCVRIPLNEHSGCDAIQVKLFGEAVHEKRVKMLLEQARATDHNLPSFESLTQKGTFYIDAYGFKHTFEEVPLALHYISTQLNEHYEQQSEEYLDLKRRWHAILEHDSTAPDSLERSRENRHLCRLGIPRSFRSRVWTLLIGQQVRDIKARFGEYYYRNLCSSQGTPAEKHYCSTHQKQINLDLLRTMPGNKHFASAGCKGVTALEAVLRAFCLHNPKLGYCQGMNFLAATALLFVSPENAFWFLVAITERYFNPSYFDQSLTGAQADQEVLKEIVEQKFPKLAQHLEDCDIDLTTITLNWFLALFFDAVPFQTMLRIWDCFLFEGPKVLFRFTIALLGLYQSEILQHSDTISVMKLLKAAVRLTYDVDGLIKTAFDELNPFPSKDSLKLRQSQFLAVLQEKLFKRQQLRKMYNVVVPASNNSARVCDLPIEVITFNEYVPGCGYVCAGNQRRGKLSLITFHDANAAVLNMLEIEFDCRPVSMVIFHREMAFVSLLSGYIVAVQLREGQAEILWELKLNDVALKLLHCENRLYCPSANGTLSVLENAFEKAPSNLDLIHIPISAAPITDAVMDEEYLYLSVACKVVILNKQTLSTVGCFYVASSAAGSHVPMFEKVRALSNSEYGLWIITAHSSLIQLWSDRECQLLFDITFDHSHRKPSFDEEEHDEQVEAYCIMYHEGEVWVGTVDGYLMFYRVADQAEFLQFGHSSSAHLGSPALTSVDVAVEADEEEEVSGDGDSSPDYPRGSEVSHSPMQKYPQYPPGKRLSPIHNLSSQIIPPHRQQMYYIPTPTETQVEEAATRNEFPESERQTRKISVKIDQATRKYSVNVHSVAKPAACATDAAPPLHPTTPTQCSQQLSRPPPPTPTPSAMLSPTIEEHPTRIDLPPPQSGKVSGDFGRRRATICKGSSVDSAVSVFSGTPSDGGACSTTTSSKDSGYVIRNHSHGSSAARIVLNHPLVRRRRGTKVGGSGGANCSPQPQSSPQLMRRKSTTAGRCRMDINFGAVSIDSPSPFLRHGSLEYDDYFELYPDDGGHNERRANGTSEKPMVKIPSSLKARGESANDVGDGVSDVFPLPDISSTDYPLPSSLPPTLPSFITTMASAPNTTGGHDNTVVALDGEEEDEREAKPDSAYPKTPPPLPAAQLLRSLLNDGEHHNTGGLKVRRKDLEFDDTLFAASVPDMERATHGHSVSFSSVDGNAMKGISARRDSKLISWAVSGGELEEKRMGTLLTMKLQMKMKISDRPVKCITLTRFNGEDVVVTGAGNYGDEEAILRWRRDKNNSGLWINDPLADTCVRGKKRTLISNASTNNRKK